MVHVCVCVYVYNMCVHVSRCVLTAGSGGGFLVLLELPGGFICVTELVAKYVCALKLVNPKSMDVLPLGRLQHVSYRSCASPGC